MISIIIPLYNKEKIIKKTLNSLLKQTYQDYEIIIVDDGSSDRSYEIVQKILKENFTSSSYKLIQQENKGAPSARNKGFEKSQGKYLLFCDADLILKPRMLEIMLKTLENNPNKAYTYCSHRYGLKLFKCFPFSIERLKKMPFIHTTSLIRRDYFPKQVWDESIKRLQDWDLWLAIFFEKKGQGIWINQVLFKIHTGGVYSSWLPSFIYKYIPFLSKVKKYKQSVKIIKNKWKI